MNIWSRLLCYLLQEGNVRLQELRIWSRLVLSSSRRATSPRACENWSKPVFVAPELGRRRYSSFATNLHQQRSQIGNTTFSFPGGAPAASGGGAPAAGFAAAADDDEEDLYS